MTMLWPMAPTVAASDFDPFTKEVAMPATVQSASTRPRAAAKPGGVTRPVPRNLLEMGLACGDGVAELEERLQEADAAKRQADRAASDQVASDELPGTAAGGDEAAAGAPASEAPSPQAIAALATEIQTVGRTQTRLAAELEALDRQRAELEAKLSRLLTRQAPPTPPAAPEPPAPVSGASSA
jgi:hypothetical protein